MPSDCVNSITRVKMIGVLFWYVCRCAVQGWLTLDASLVTLHDAISTSPMNLQFIQTRDSSRSSVPWSVLSYHKQVINLEEGKGERERERERERVSEWVSEWVRELSERASMWKTNEYTVNHFTYQGDSKAPYVWLDGVATLSFHRIDPLRLKTTYTHSNSAVQEWPMQGGTAVTIWTYSHIGSAAHFHGLGNGVN